MFTTWQEFQMFKRNMFIKCIDIGSHNLDVRFFTVKSDAKQYTILYKGNVGVVRSPHSRFLIKKNDVLTQVITCERNHPCLLRYVNDKAIC